MSLKNNYSLRLNKDIERKLIAQNLLELKKYSYVFEDYLYVGFWSIYFMDFKLFHKALGIKNMLSFEKGDPSRPQFNNPYDFIKIKQWDFSDHYNSEVDFNKKIFFRLDYEDSLTDDILRDIDNIVRSKITQWWTIFSISLHCHLPFNDEKKEEYINKFRGEWSWYLKGRKNSQGTEDLPKINDIKSDNLIDKYIEILEGKIKDCLGWKELDYVILYKYSYRDWSRMFTMWFLLDSKEKIAQIKEEIQDVSIININAPILTLKEKDAFNKNLSGIDDILKDETDNKEFRISERLGYQLNKEWVEDYLKLYKEYPHFTEVTL